MHLATAWFGVLLLEQGTPVAHRLFPSDGGAVAERLERLAAGEVLEEERALAAQAGAAFTVAEARLMGLKGATRGDPVPLLDLASRVGVPPSLYKSALHELARRRIRTGLADPDRHVMEAVTALDEVNDSLNLLGERITDWCGLHAPEAVAAAQDLGAFARTLAATTDRAALAKQTGTDATGSLGSELTPSATSALQALAAAYVATETGRTRIESHLDEAVRLHAPNLCVLVGPRIGGRLIHLAGGLHALARLPASTVQTLGAEKALFRHITAGTPPPKHGVLFQHALVNRAHPRLRGRIARMLAGRVAIAARADATTRRDLGAGLRADVEARAHRAHAQFAASGRERGGRRRPDHRRGGRG